jgi:hypothetical protein
MNRGSRLVLLVATAAAGLAAAAGSAGASTGLLGQLSSGVVGSLGNCGYGSSSQVFRQWLDLGEYSLAPQGDLSSTSAWALSGATVSSAHDPYGLSVRSLAFSANGATAVTPAMCVNLQNPDVRFLVSDKGGDGSAYFDLALRYVGLDGKVHTIGLGRVYAGKTWQPTPIVLLGLNLLSVASSNGWTAIALELHAGGLSSGETVSADGIWVDPCRSV